MHRTSDMWTVQYFFALLRTQIDNPAHSWGNGREEARSKCATLFKPLEPFFKKIFEPSKFILIGNGSLNSDYFMIAEDADYVIADKSYLTTNAARANHKAEIIYMVGNTKGPLGKTDAFGIAKNRHGIEYGKGKEPVLMMSTINDEKNPMTMEETAKWIMTH